MNDHRPHYNESHAQKSGAGPLFGILIILIALIGVAGFTATHRDTTEGNPIPLIVGDATPVPADQSAAVITSTDDSSLISSISSIDTSVLDAQIEADLERIDQITGSKQ